MKTFKIMLLGLGISVASFSVFAKRMAPATIAPITTKHGIIEHSFERNDQGFRVYVLMKDKAGDLRWKTKIFSRKYEKNLETDVQDIHLKKLSILKKAFHFFDYYIVPMWSDMIL